MSIKPLPGPEGFFSLSARPRFLRGSGPIGHRRLARARRRQLCSYPARAMLMAGATDLESAASFQWQ